MEAFFSWRKTRASDLPKSLKLHPAKNGAEGVGSRRAGNAWQQLFEMKHATKSAVVEMHREGSVEIVGFGFSAFVKKSFAEAEIQNPRPGLNRRIIESLVSGNSVIATYEEVRDANTRGDLQQVVLDVSWKNGRLNASEVAEVIVLLGRAYQEIHAGYNFSRTIGELVDELDFWQVRGHRSLQVVDRFEAYRLANPDTTWNAERALIVASVESMGNDPHSIAAELFQRRLQPQFAFTRGEQDLLELGLEGSDDALSAKALFVSLPAIKHRWANIYERVAASRPDLCPPDASGTRGVQKRQRVLTYVRNHPEELRPFNFEKRASK